MRARRRHGRGQCLGGLREELAEQKAGGVACLQQAGGGEPLPLLWKFALAETMFDPAEGGMEQTVARYESQWRGAATRGKTARYYPGGAIPPLTGDNRLGSDFLARL
jgi:hypothetical protein